VVRGDGVASSTRACARPGGGFFLVAGPGQVVPLPVPTALQQVALSAGEARLLSTQTARRSTQSQTAWPLLGRGGQSERCSIRLGLPACRCRFAGVHGLLQSAAPGSREQGSLRDSGERGWFRRSPYTPRGGRARQELARSPPRACCRAARVWWWPGGEFRAGPGCGSGLPLDVGCRGSRRRPRGGRVRGLGPCANGSRWVADLPGPGWACW